MTRDKPSAAATVAQEESDRLTATRLVLYALTVIQGGLSSVEELGDRMAPAAKAFLVGWGCRSKQPRGGSGVLSESVRKAGRAAICHSS